MFDVIEKIIYLTRDRKVEQNEIKSQTHKKNNHVYLEEKIFNTIIK
jgi:hypothetical protein